MKESNQKKALLLRDRGITLVSLIITIVIIVILAAVLINISLNNMGLIDSSSEATKLYAIEQYQGTIEEGVQKKILEEAALGEEISQVSIQEELNEIGDTSRAYYLDASSTENVGDVIVKTDEEYLFSAYYDENTGKQYVEYLGEGDSTSISSLYLSYSDGKITATATANNGNSIEKIEVQKSGETISYENGSTITYSVNSGSGMYVVKVTTTERNIEIWICIHITNIR